MTDGEIFLAVYLTGAVLTWVTLVADGLHRLRPRAFLRALRSVTSNYGPWRVFVAWGLTCLVIWWVVIIAWSADRLQPRG